MMLEVLPIAVVGGKSFGVSTVDVLLDLTHMVLIKIQRFVICHAKR